MSLINFAQGNKENYKAQEMQDTIYLSDNSKEILFNDQSYGNATPADEEDITAEDGNLKLRDRAYDADNFSGKGYKILRKNIQDGKNILTQDMVNEPNTIYEIRYDFDLNGATINIPDGCTLKFGGGSINNGLVQGNQQSPEFNAKHLIKIEGDISSSFMTLDVNSVDWAGFRGVLNVKDFGLIDTLDDCSDVFNQAMLKIANLQFSRLVIYFPRGRYVFKSPINIRSQNIILRGDTRCNVDIDPALLEIYTTVAGSTLLYEPQEGSTTFIPSNISDSSGNIHGASLEDIVIASAQYKVTTINDLSAQDFPTHHHQEIVSLPDVNGVEIAVNQHIQNCLINNNGLSHRYRPQIQWR